MQHSGLKNEHFSFFHADLIQDFPRSVHVVEKQKKIPAIEAKKILPLNWGLTREGGDEKITRVKTTFSDQKLTNLNLLSLPNVKIPGK